MNTFKKTGGFTLVELIIVIAILAILSSVAVAGYSRYITKAQEAADDAWKTEIRTAATLANAMEGSITVMFDKMDVVDSNGYVLIYTTSELAGDFADLFEDSVTCAGGGEVGVDGVAIPADSGLPEGTTYFTYVKP